MTPLNSTFQIPTFVRMLWKMLENQQIEDVISWSSNGQTIIIKNEERFRTVLLPQYYKHNNMSSFIRQLNMYGFHRVSNEIEHPFFKKQEPHLLINIKRKNGKQRLTSSEQVEQLVADVQNLYTQQNCTNDVLNNLKRENAVLWRVIIGLQQKQMQYEKTLNKLISFLVTIVQPNTRFSGDTHQKVHSLMIQGKPSEKVKSPAEGPTIHELGTADITVEANMDAMNDVDNEPVLHENDSHCTELNLDPNALLKETGTEQIEDPTINLPEEHFVFPSLDSPILTEDSGIIKLDALRNIFLKSPIQDPLLSSIFNDSFNSVNIKKDAPPTVEDINNMQVAECRNNNDLYPWLNSLENTENDEDPNQNEVDQLKKFFNTYNPVDFDYMQQFAPDLMSEDDETVFGI